jgi:hypothetical protein
MMGERGRHAGVRRWYRALLGERRARQSLRALDRSRTEARGDEAQSALLLRRWMELEETLLAVALSPRPATMIAPRPRLGRWRLLLDAGDPQFAGPPGVRLTDRDGALELTLPAWGAVLCTNR